MKWSLAKRAGWSLAVLAGIAALGWAAIFGRWLALAGPRGGSEAVVRFLRYGDTDIDDFERYPARRLRASAFPRPFAVAPPERSLTSASAVGNERFRDLDHLFGVTSTIALLVVQEDTIRFERYANGRGGDAPSQYFSVTKSVLSALLGAALDDGIIRSLRQAVTDFVPELAARGFDRVTLEDLVTMTSGSDYVEADNPFGVHVPFNYTSDIERMILRFSVDDEPGAIYRYKSGDTALLALALQRALAPQTLTGYAQERLWSPLGAEHDAVWSLDRQGGLEKAWCCLAGTARDLAKIGRLYLDGGRVGETQLLSREWIERSLGSGALGGSVWPAEWQAAGFWSYGYGWWLLSKDEGDFLAQGKDGQLLWASPADRTVVVRLGRSDGGLPLREWVTVFRTLAEAARAS